jgi:hypothetical protein
VRAGGSAHRWVKRVSRHATGTAPVRHLGAVRRPDRMVDASTMSAYD